LPKSCRFQYVADGFGRHQDQVDNFALNNPDIALIPSLESKTLRKLCTGRIPVEHAAPSQPLLGPSRWSALKRMVAFWRTKAFQEVAGARGLVHYHAFSWLVISPSGALLELHKELIKASPRKWI